MAVAVVEAGGYGSVSTPSLGTSIDRICGPKIQKKKKKKIGYGSAHVSLKHFGLLSVSVSHAP